MGVKISNLPAIVTPALTDVFPVVQAGVTYKETFTQLSALIAASSVTTITGTANQVIASASVGPVTLSLPQSIATTSDVTFGSVTFSPTTKGIVGTTTNNDASSTYVGELLSSTYASGVSVTSTVATNVGSISLTAGDWDVWGYLHTVPDAGTTTSNISVNINATTATLSNPTTPATAAICAYPFAVAAGNQAIVNTGVARLSLAATTTYYLNTNITFAVSTMTVNGQILARRRR